MTLNINRDNFATLAAHLESLVPPPEFGMSSFFRMPWDRDTSVGYVEIVASYMTTGTMPPCGAVACAVGHGPIAGVLDPKATCWNDYIQRNFILDADVNHMERSEVYRWCFSCSWGRIDNSPEGAAERIRYMLAHGIPENFNEADESWMEVYTNA